MTISSLVRRSLAAAALAAVPLAGLASPAQAASSAPEQAVPAAGQVGGPQAHIFSEYIEGTTGSFTPVAAGRPVKLTIGFNLGGNRGDYTNLHYATSHPGTSLCGPLSNIGPGTARPGQGLTCPVVLPAMKPGTSQKYSVTLTGKRAGKAFSVTASTLLYAPDLRVGVYLDGKRIDGTTQVIPASKKTVTLKYVLDNKSTATVRYGYPMVPFTCELGTIAPGRSGWCSATVKREDIVDYTKRLGSYDMGNVSMSIGAAWTQAAVRPTHLIAR